ncbi:MAG: glycosyltransferase [Candidatus Bathyarchaeia archaeon]
MEVSVIIPAYNEEVNIKRAISEVDEVLSREGVSYEIIVVDDGSNDATYSLALGTTAKVIRHKVNQGKGAAVRTGIEASVGKIIVIQDADLTIPARFISTLLRRIKQEGYDIANASRLKGDIAVGAMPRYRKVGNILYAKITSLLTHQHLTDTLSGQKAFKREVFIGWRLKTAGWPDFEIIFKTWAMGFKTCEVPVSYLPRKGKSKLKTASAALWFLLQILRWYLWALSYRCGLLKPLTQDSNQLWDKEVRAHYDKLAPIYDRRKDTAYYRKVEEIVREHIPMWKFVLDVGCGSGKLLRDIFEVGVGVDLSSGLIRAAHSLSKRHDFIVADAKHLPFKSAVFSGVTCVDMLEHVSDLEVAVMEISRVTAQGGTLVITSPNPSYSPLFHLLELLKLKLPEGPHKWVEDQLIRKLLVKEGFSCETFSTCYGIIHGIIGVKQPSYNIEKS